MTPLIDQAGHSMGSGDDETGRVWSALSRKEDSLKWGGYQSGDGRGYDSGARRSVFSPYGGSAWGNSTMGRVDRVRKALEDSGPLALRILAQKFAGINISAIWPILAAACKDIALYYGGSVVTGTLIGGVGGFFLGGVGAMPGASAGAALGSAVGGWILAFLGLKSLIEGVIDAIPEALRYYEAGFREAWGPTQHDLPGAKRSRGSTFFAANDFANGHVLMFAAILAILIAFVTRGKGDRLARLNEIRQSRRLGPTVATWVEQNADRLRNHPALQSQGGGSQMRPTVPMITSQPRRPRELEANAPKGMPKKKVPCFTTKGLPQGSVPEFDRQLMVQQAGLNDMTVNEYLKGREAFKAGESVRDPSVARKARADYQLKLQNDLVRKLRNDGLTVEAAEAKARKQTASTMKTLAALHNPDMVAAGKDKISGFGDRNVNSRIGAQWNKHERLAELDRAASQVPESHRHRTNMNAHLERCK